MYTACKMSVQRQPPTPRRARPRVPLPNARLPLSPSSPAETVRAMTHVINQGMAMYWGTSRWSSMEIMVGLLQVLAEASLPKLLLEERPRPRTVVGSGRRHCRH